MKRVTTMWILAFILLTCIPAFAQATETGTAKPIVVASTTQIADFTRQIAGDRVVVKSIMAPGDLF